MSSLVMPQRFNCCLVVLCTMLLFGIGCDVKSTDSETAAPGGVSSGIKDARLPDFQNKLLDIAFEVASSIPEEPHIKDRCKMQDHVVRTCLELKQPLRAAGMIDQIGNWRKGDCYVDLAMYYAERDDYQTASCYLQKAEIILTQIEEKMADDEINWRRDRIKGKIEQVQDFIKQWQGSQNTTTPVSGSINSFDEQVKIFDELIATGGFEAAQNSLSAYVNLYGQFYSDSDRRTQIEAKVKASWGRLPYFTRIELLSHLAEIELTHSNPQDAVRFVNEAQTFINSFQWPTDKRIALTSELVCLRFRCGDVDKASTDAEAMTRLYEAERDKIFNIYRATVLRTLAEAYVAIGNASVAMKTYEQAIEEGVVNTNSRPRAEDLSATCCSMALAGIEPDKESWSRINQIHSGLGKPW